MTIKLKSSSAPKPPKHLSGEAREVWLSLAEEYAISDAGGLLLLNGVCECLQRVREAQAMLAKDGSVTADRWGQLKPHPAAAQERDARSGMLSSLRQLHLDIEPLKAIGRPGKG